MKPATTWEHKGEAVEEWLDLRFFRPAGAIIARAAARTPLSADHLTQICLVIGLAADALLVPANRPLNALAVALFVVSDIFDSADGQLARLRGASTRFGRLLDGTSDALRFGLLYVALMARLILAEYGWEGVALGAGALISHLGQAAITDYLRQFYLFIAAGRQGELDLPEDVERLQARTRFQRLQLSMYDGFIRRQIQLCPWSTEAARQLRSGQAPTDLPAMWAGAQTSGVRALAWTGLNIRFLLLALLVVPGHPAAFCWVTIVPLNLIAAALLLTHERNARQILGGDARQPPARARAA